MTPLLALLAALPLHAEPTPDAAQLERMAGRFAPTEVRADVSKLSAGDRKALRALLKASRAVDDLFLAQVWEGNAAKLKALDKDSSPLGRARRHYFWINKGPWSRVDQDAPFLPDVPAKKPPEATFYPAGSTKDEIEAWIKTLTPAQQEHAKGFFSVVRRDEDGKLQIVPYSREYALLLKPLAKYLRKAAEATDNDSLKRFLDMRADALASDDYVPSDLAWMDLDAPIEPTIGPYETYEDGLLGYKAAFEAFVALRDDAETARLSAFSAHLQDIEDHLPIPPERRNPKVAAAAPIRVVNEIYAGGDGNRGVQMAAFNLPNDERVITKKGSKRVMIKNVQQAKFDSVLTPIAAQVLPQPARADLDFPAFFAHILAHELCHGLGPHQITVEGRATTPRAELKDLYTAIEEAKADAVGLFAIQYLMDNNDKLQIPGLATGPAAERKLYATYLASSFRTLRFGLNEAHGRGMALQLNYLLDRGAFTVGPDGTFAVDYAVVKDGVRELAHDLLMIEAEGSRARAESMLSRLGVVRPPVQAALDRLKAIPIDIEPLFTTADAVLAGK